MRSSKKLFVSEDLLRGGGVITSSPSMQNVPGDSFFPLLSSSIHLDICLRTEKDPFRDPVKEWLERVDCVTRLFSFNSVCGDERVRNRIRLAARFKFAQKFSNPVPHWQLVRLSFRRQIGGC